MSYQQLMAISRPAKDAAVRASKGGSAVTIAAELAAALSDKPPLDREAVIAELSEPFRK